MFFGFSPLRGSTSLTYQTPRTAASRLKELHQLFKILATYTIHTELPRRKTGLQKLGRYKASGVKIPNQLSQAIAEESEFDFYCSPVLR